MKTLSHPARPYVVAAALFLAGAGLLLLMSTTKSSKPDATTTAKAGTVEDLESPRVVQSVPCSGYVRFDPDGRLESCVLSEEHVFGAVVLPSNTEVRRFRPDRTPEDVHLGQDARFDGHLCRGEGPGSWMTGFHTDGRLKYCFLVDRETIDGFACEKGTFWGEMTGGVIVQFHPDGKLESCRLAADATVAGRTFEKGQRIWLDAEGKPTAKPSDH